MKVYVTYNETRRGGKPLSKKRWSSREDTHVDFQLTGVCLEEPKAWYKEPFELDCKELPKVVYVVLVRYSDGDTFGNSYGHGHIEGVYLSEDDAQKVVEAIRNDKYKSKETYVPWVGYFNRLESANYHPMVVRKYPMVE